MRYPFAIIGLYKRAVRCLRANVIAVTGLTAFTALLSLLTPTVTHARSALNLFDKYYAQAGMEMPRTMPDWPIQKFVMQEMLTWSDSGVLIYPSDIYAARVGQGWDAILCGQKDDDTPAKFTPDGKPLVFWYGADTEEGGGCAELRQAINSIVDAELEAQALGNSLVAVVNGGELSTADEAHRPSAVGLTTLLVNRVWSNTGSRVLPWPGSPVRNVESEADKALEELDQALSANARDIDAILWRFHHGYFRDKREEDTVLKEYGKSLVEGDDSPFAKLARALQITGDVAKVGKGEYVTPMMNYPNVSLWARADDLGLMWTVPDHMNRIGDIRPAGTYAEYHGLGDILAYPWSYTGTWDPPDKAIFDTPLCSRTAGSLGYLCRPIESPPENCSIPDDLNAIVLQECSYDVRESNGPDICPDMTVLFQDTGIPLADPNSPSELNPALTPADPLRICKPENRVLYKDEVMSHACYIAHCVAQSHSGHTLVTNRNVTLTNEMTSPFLGCLRQDPQLGLYAELSQMTPFAMPLYVGHSVLTEYELEYCNQVGIAPSGLAGLCTYFENRRVSSPVNTLAGTALSAVEEGRSVGARQITFRVSAPVIGQRIAAEQVMPVYARQVKSLANLVRETAILLNELEKTSLTSTACPWTGPFPQRKP